MKIYILNKTGKVLKTITEFNNLSRRINNIYLDDRNKDKWIIFSNEEINFTYSFRKFISISNNMIIYKNIIGILFKNWEFLNNCNYKTFNQVKEYLLKSNCYNSFEKIKDDLSDFNYFNDDLFNKIKIISNDNYLFVIPFMYNGDRWKIFEKCISNLYSLIKDKPKFDICIHECGTKKCISDFFIKNYNIKYIYSYWDTIFNRAWTLNKPCKQFNNYNNYIFMDGDLIIKENLLNQLYQTEFPCVGWNKLHYMSKHDTDVYLQTNKLLTNHDRTVKPSLQGASGGITIVPHDIFFELKGWPENFKGTWGGEDNLYYSKLTKFGYDISYLNSTVYHLYHSHKTHRDNNIRKKWYIWKNWNKEKWLEEFKKINDNWGE